MEAALTLHRYSAFGELSPAEVHALHRLAGPAVGLDAGRDVRSASEGRAGPVFLLEGWAMSSVDLPDGGRQVLKVHLPGDIMGAPGLPFEGPVETLTSLTRVRVSAVSLTALGELFAQAPRLGAVLYLGAQAERVELMDRLTAVGRLDAESSVLALFVHLYDRLAPLRPDGDPDAVLPLPMTQPQIADALGLTSVHVSRILRRLERDGRIRRRGRVIDLVDLARLRRTAALPRRTVQPNPSWLPAHA